MSDQQSIDPDSLIMQAAKDRVSSSIIADKKERIPQVDIIESNKNKWKEESKSYGNAYNETADYTNFSNTDDADAGSIIKIIIDIYMETAVVNKEDAVIVNKLKENLNNVIDINRILTSKTDKRELLCKLESFINHVL